MQFHRVRRAPIAAFGAAVLALSAAAGAGSFAQTITAQPRSEIDAARARVSALSKLTPHAYSLRLVAQRPDARGDVLYRGSGVPSSAKLDCARLGGPAIGQVTGGESVQALTIAGSCFGPAPGGQVLLRAQSGERLLSVQSWSDSSVRVFFAGERGGSQTLSLRVGVPLTTSAVATSAGTYRAGTARYAYSSPVQLAYVAPVVVHDGNGRVSNISCALNGNCEATWGFDMTTCPGGGQCRIAYHPASRANVTSPDGIDLWRITLKPGFTLDTIFMYDDSAGVFIDQNPSDGHIDFRVHWKYEHFHELLPPDPGSAKRSYYDYNDGSYMFYVTLRGPEGVDP